VLQIVNLVKRFGRGEGLPALRGISFRVEAGEIFGVLGADGAGKTTLLRILTGLLLPTSGQATVAGVDVAIHRNRLGEIIGYMPQTPPMPHDMTLGGYLEFWARVAGMPRGTRRETIDRWVGFFGLGEHVSMRVPDCITYVQRQMYLAVSLLSDPPVLLLDEPMSGLSILEWDHLSVKLRTLTEGGRTILLTSPKLATLRRVCSRIVTLADGRATSAYETPVLLKALGEARHARVFIEADGPRPSVVAALREVPGILEIGGSESALTLTAFIDPATFDAEKARQVLHEAGIGIRSIREPEIILGDVVRTLVRGESS